MIEERPIFNLHQRVLVKELDVSGTIYERATADSGHRIYGVKLKRVVVPKNFVATEVWHCRSERLEAIKGNPVGHKE